MSEQLTEQARRTPDAVFLETYNAEYSYAEIERLVAESAAKTDLVGRVGVIRPEIDVEAVVGILAHIRAGVTTVLLAPQLPGQVASKLKESAFSETRPCHTILFTSGSSGGPKGVRFSAANWEAAAAASMASLGHGPGDRWLCPLPLYHVGGLSIIFRSLAAGGHVMLAPDLNQASRWLDRVQFASVVSTQLHRILLNRSDSFLTSPRVLVGGGPIDHGLLNKAATAGLTVLPTYGMTETTSQVATARPGDPQRRLFPLEGVEVRIGAEQQIEVKGRTISLGYLGEPDRSQDNWFSTSDLGRIEPDGSLVVLGRLDRVIISGGENVDPAEVEAAIALIPGIGEVAVIGLPDQDWGEVVAAAYVGDVVAHELRSRVKDHLPAYALPKRWLRVEALPRTDLDKIDSAALAALFG